MFSTLCTLAKKGGNRQYQSYFQQLLSDRLRCGSSSGNLVKTKHAFLRGLLGTKHPSTLVSMNKLATVLSDQGKNEQAEEMHRRALGLKKTVLGKKHTDTLMSMNNLAIVLSDQGKYEQVEEMLQQALGLMKVGSR